jgi:hypothetical protein
MRRWIVGLLLLGLVAVAAAQVLPQMVPVPDGPAILDTAAPLNRQHPLNRAVVGAWQVLPRLSGGAFWYNLAASYHGTLTNMTTAGGASGWGSTTRTGGYGELRFDGTDDAVTVGTVAAYDFPNQQFTVSVCHRSTASALAYLVARRNSTCSTVCSGWFLRINSDGTYNVRLVDQFNTSTASRTSVTTTANNGAWHHLAAVFTTDTTTLANNDVTIYHNGLLDQGVRTDSAIGPYVVPVLPLVFGTTSDAVAGGFLAGALDVVWILNRGVAASEMLALAQTCTQRNPLLAARTLGLPLAAIGAVTRSRGRVF